MFDTSRLLADILFCVRDTKEPVLLFGIGGEAVAGTDFPMCAEFERGIAAGEGCLLPVEGIETVSECDLVKPVVSLCIFRGIVGFGIGGGRGLEGV